MERTFPRQAQQDAISTGGEMIDILAFIWSVIFDDGGASEIMVLSCMIPTMLNRIGRD